MVITRGLPHNVTTEMDLELWEITRRLRTAGFGRLLEKLPQKKGKRPAFPNCARRWRGKK